MLSHSSASSLLRHFQKHTSPNPTQSSLPNQDTIDLAHSKILIRVRVDIIVEVGIKDGTKADQWSGEYRR